MRTMPAGEFKAKCLSIMDEVASTGEPVLVTKRGKPVVRIVSPEELPQRTVDAESIFGAFRGLITISGDPANLVDPIFPVDDWDHLKQGPFPFPAEDDLAR